MLNDYLNGYTEKLARATTIDPSKIKIDQMHFGKIVKAVNASTFNPYREYKEIQQEIRVLDQKYQAMKLLKKEEARKLKDGVMSRDQSQEDLELKQQVKEITKKHNEDADSKHAKLYSKGLSVNKFKNFSSVMHDLYDRSVDS